MRTSQGVAYETKNREKMTARKKNNTQIWFAYGWNYVTKIKSAGKPKKFIKNQITQHIATRSRKSNYFDQSYIAGVKAAIKHISLGHSPQKIEIIEKKRVISTGPGRRCWHPMNLEDKSRRQFSETLSKDSLSYIKSILRVSNEN